MVSTSRTLRQRNRNKPQISPTNSDTVVAPKPPRFSLKTTVVKCVQFAVLFIAPPLIGVLCAACISDVRAAVPLFVVTLVTVLLILFLAFMSVYRENDQTLIRIPNVYNADGTVTRQDSTTVFEHDQRFATHYATELPAFALASAWFYLWTQRRFIFIVFALYVAYRVGTHPFFAVHVWNSVKKEEVERPFGTSPLFQHDKGPVIVIEGKDAFKNALNNAASETLVVVDASATWCPPCRKMAPEFEKLASEFKESTFLSVDVDVSKDIASLLQVTSIPSFFLYKDGKQISSVRGASLANLRSAIETNL